MSHDLSRALETFKLCVNGTSPPIASGLAHARTALHCANPGDIARALTALRAEGFDADWQLLIEIQQEQETDTQQQAASPR
jgi:hypothetical protein